MTTDHEAKARALVEAERVIFLPIGEIDRLISAIATALREAEERAIAKERER